MRAKLKDGSIVELKKECGCVIHDGPCWIHADKVYKRLNDQIDKTTELGQMAYCREESNRLRQLLHEFEKRDIVEIFR